ncbi:proteasome accessory factor PafA2 [Demequina sp. TTPB684]|uniref:depupylase/deamidase Dop n=1 Tax=unclassified Demequina TaxID=2620311 RepID=UPI001CF0E007|nr:MULTISPECIES: depupylase/deamidase Dop [unclassified Demequina]MCB2413924.1 proteasome accessory factor PafA2 [Demequina sp. TTPB684]UPU89388.1 proteasome accessory factor PafA2 [Demequina sp. TMPB413]
MRVVGIETEYGITDPRNATANPILLSSQLVQACRVWSGNSSTRWDYGGEDPLMDLRGMRRDRRYATADLLTDSPEYSEANRGVTLRRRRGSWEDPAHLNAVLANGARFYVDHAHPEYSGPEVTNAREAVVWDVAGDRIAAAAAAQMRSEGDDVALYKNNVDGKGASYGTHENYLVTRDLAFDDLARLLMPHLVSRQIVVGAGRVGLGVYGEIPGFQMSQRADYIEAEAGLETTLRRPIVNTRDEPHADRRKWRRLHIIIGDANSMELPTYLKVGATSLVLSAIEARDERLELLTLADPVAEVSAVSRDLTLRHKLRLASGEEATALEVQRALITVARDYVTDVEDARVIERWENVLDALGRDPLSAQREVEWVAKLHLFGRMRERYATTDGAGDRVMPAWDDDRLRAADVQWSELGTGLAARLSAAGAVERVVSDSDVDHAMTTPPSTTRAWLRGRMVSRRSDLVDAASWSTIVLDREAEHGHLEVLTLPDPLVTRHELVDALLAEEPPPATDTRG